MRELFWVGIYEEWGAKHFLKESREIVQGEKLCTKEREDVDENYNERWNIVWFITDCADKVVVKITKESEGEILCDQISWKEKRTLVSMSKIQRKIKKVEEKEKQIASRKELEKLNKEAIKRIENEK